MYDETLYGDWYPGHAFQSESSLYNGWDESRAKVDTRTEFATCPSSLFSAFPGSASGSNFSLYELRGYPSFFDHIDCGNHLFPPTSPCLRSRSPTGRRPSLAAPRPLRHYELGGFLSTFNNSFSLPQIPSPTPPDCLGYNYYDDDPACDATFHLVNALFAPYIRSNRLESGPNTMRDHPWMALSDAVWHPRPHVAHGLDLFLTTFNQTQSIATSARLSGCAVDLEERNGELSVVPTDVNTDEVPTDSDAGISGSSRSRHSPPLRSFGSILERLQSSEGTGTLATSRYSSATDDHYAHVHSPGRVGFFMPELADKLSVSISTQGLSGSSSSLSVAESWYTALETTSYMDLPVIANAGLSVDPTGAGSGGGLRTVASFSGFPTCHSEYAENSHPTPLHSTSYSSRSLNQLYRAHSDAPSALDGDMNFNSSGNYHSPTIESSDDGAGRPHPASKFIFVVTPDVGSQSDVCG